METRQGNDLRNESDLKRRLMKMTPSMLLMKGTKKKKKKLFSVKVS